ncbi:hypothetical protein [Mangrovicoccus ximenensis]|uniref:hypothetical protein n=1 Tax=Mangrovicoccus ximenensis TaxID=1911570 RepID=UPI000D3D7F79|nr:hypothetical protein [Mangrovicoccus ximenensis]
MADATVRGVPGRAGTAIFAFALARIAGRGARRAGRRTDGDRVLRVCRDRVQRDRAPDSAAGHARLPDPPQGLILGYAAFDEDLLARAAEELAALLVRAAG